MITVSMSINKWLNTDIQHVIYDMTEGLNVLRYEVSWRKMNTPYKKKLFPVLLFDYPTHHICSARSDLCPESDLGNVKTTWGHELKKYGRNFLPEHWHVIPTQWEKQKSSGSLICIISDYKNNWFHTIFVHQAKLHGAEFFLRSYTSFS